MSEFSARHRFSNWPSADVSPVAARVYAVSEGERLIYCGMSGRGFEKALATRAKLGPTTRLASHASGRLSADQFCVYVANRLVIPTLGAGQLVQFADGTLTLDALSAPVHPRPAGISVSLRPDEPGALRAGATLPGRVIVRVKPLLNPA